MSRPRPGPARPAHTRPKPDVFKLFSAQARPGPAVCRPRPGPARPAKLCRGPDRAWTQSPARAGHYYAYQSGMYKLYDEVDTGSCGQKPATSNVALHVGLQDSTIGITKMRNILAATNTPPPSRYGLQRNADRVAAITAR